MVCYKGNPVSFWLATKLVKVKYISLVNLIMDKPVVTELIQDELNEKSLQFALNKILNDSAYLKELMADYKALWHKLGDSHASNGAARAIVSLAKK